MKLCIVSNWSCLIKISGSRVLWEEELSCFATGCSSDTCIIFCFNTENSFRHMAFFGAGCSKAAACYAADSSPKLCQ